MARPQELWYFPTFDFDNFRSEIRYWCSNETYTAVFPGKIWNLQNFTKNCIFWYLKNWYLKTTLRNFLKTSEMVDNNARNHSWKFQVQEKSETILTNFLGAVFGTFGFLKIFFWNHIFLKPSEMVDHNARNNPWQFQVQKMSRTNNAKLIYAKKRTFWWFLHNYA